MKRLFLGGERYLAIFGEENDEVLSAGAGP